MPVLIFLLSFFLGALISSEVVLTPEDSVNHIKVGQYLCKGDLAFLALSRISYKAECKDGTRISMPDNIDNYIAKEPKI